jgi:hypothetical protein
LTHYSPTIESTHRKAVKCNNLDILAEIVDTAGMDEYSRLSRNASVGVDGYVLVYSITSMASLEKVLGKYYIPIVIVSAFTLRVFGVCESRVGSACLCLHGLGTIYLVPSPQHTPCLADMDV